MSGASQQENMGMMSERSFRDALKNILHDKVRMAEIQQLYKLAIENAIHVRKPGNGPDINVSRLKTIMSPRNN